MRDFKPFLRLIYWMTTTPGIWRNRKELLWSGYYPGRCTERKPETMSTTDRDEIVLFLTLYINHFMGQQLKYEESANN